MRCRSLRSAETAKAWRQDAGSIYCFVFAPSRLVARGRWIPGSPGRRRPDLHRALPVSSKDRLGASSRGEMANPTHSESDLQEVCALLIPQRVGWAPTILALWHRTKIFSGAHDRDPGCRAQPCLAVCVGLRRGCKSRKVHLEL